MGKATSECNLYARLFSRIKKLPLVCQEADGREFFVVIYGRRRNDAVAFVRS